MKVAFLAQPRDLIPPIHNQSLAIWIHEISHQIAEVDDVTIISRASNLLPEDDDQVPLAYRRVSTAIDDLLHKLARVADRLTGRFIGESRNLYFKYYYFTWLYYFIYALLSSWYLRQDKFDAVVLLNFSQFIPTIRKLNPRLKIILVMQCDWLIELKKATVSERLNQLDAVVGCSDYITNGIRQRFPKHQHKCFTVHNSSNTAIFSKNDRVQIKADLLRKTYRLDTKRCLLYVGRITPEKGAHVLVESMHLIVQHHPDTVLLLVGSFARNPPSPAELRGGADSGGFKQWQDGEYKKHLLERAKSIGDKVVFVGTVAYEQLAAYYAICDVFVHPAIWNEPFGMILTEAMSCERPIVSTRVGGIPEIVVSGETGLLVNPDNSKELATAIIQLLDNKQWAENMGQAGLERASKAFSWKRSARMLRTILRN